MGCEMCSSVKMFILIALIGLATAAWSQSTYLVEYDHDSAPILFPEHIVSSLDGSYVASFGQTYLDQKPAAFFLQTDAAGGFAGGKFYHLPGNVLTTNTATATSDSGYVLIGRSGASFSDHELFALKVSGTGSVQWKKRYTVAGNDDVRKVLEVPDGYLLLGSGGYTNYAKLLLMKIDRLGNLKWKRLIDATAPSVGLVGFAIERFGQGGALISGVYGDGLILVNVNSGGKVLWARKYTASKGYHFGALGSITGARDGGLLVTAVSRKGDTLDGFSVIKTDPAGKALWTRFFTSSALGRLSVWDASATLDGGVTLVGTIANRDKLSLTAFAVKVNGDGALQWKRLFDRYELSTLTGVTGLPDGTVAAAGTGRDLSFLVRLSQNGEITGTCDRYHSFSINASTLDVASAPVSLRSSSLTATTGNLSVRSDDFIETGTEVCYGFKP